MPQTTIAPTKEAGPVDVIESRGVRIPIYLNPRRGKVSYLVTYFAKGERKRERVSNLADARKRAKALVPELMEGKVHVASFTLKQTAAITEAAEILAPLHVSITEVARQYAHAHKILEGKPLMEAVDFYAKHLAREALHGALAPVTLPDLVKKYFESIDGEKSKRYVQDLQAKLNRAAKAFTGQLRDIRPDDIDGPQRTAALLLLLPYGGDKKRRAGSLGGRKQPEDVFRALSGVGHGSRSQGMVWPQPFCDWQNMKSDKRLSLIFIFDFCIKLSGKMPNI